MSEQYSFSWGEGSDDALRITAAPSPVYPDTCKFTLSKAIYPDSAVHFASKEASQGSPLAEQILAIEDITQVLIAGDYIDVVIGKPKNWEEFAPQVATTIREQIATGKPPVSPSIKENLPSPDKLRERVSEILDRDVNPSISSHGGFVKLLDVKGNTLFLEFGGGCQGCGMANVTLKYGVERHLRSQVPEIGEIFDTTNHASGNNPYYAPPSGHCG
ncbi:MAG: NifU family protein [Candidatus Latescibacterota bacterium]